MTLADWKTIKIKEMGRVVTGKTPPTSRTEYFGGKYPFITPTDIDGINREVTTERFLSDQGRDYQKRLLLPEWAIAFVCIGATIGKICIVDRPSFTNQQINSVIVNQDDFDSRFAFYALKFATPSIINVATGSATPIVNKTKFSNIEIKVPKRSTQEKIGEILSTFDDLIKNNNRRVVLLEEAIHRLYREWFVHLRFPGHEDVTIVEGVPEGWKFLPIGEMAQVKGGKRLPKGESLSDTPTKHPYLRVKDFSDTGIVESNLKYLSDNTFERISTYVITDDDLYISIAGTIGRVGFIPSHLTGSNLTENAAKICDIKAFIDRKLILYYLKSSKGQKVIKSKAVGTSQPKLALYKIKQIKIPVPPKNLQQAVSPFFSDIEQQIEALNKQNSLLRQARDALLPRLMAGSLTV